ncbi:NIPSNAP family protein [Actinoplanes sp. URMC 104]|uniref:NIPSNAP family protein n=1 Tax=Actinoplanes sp. URMC 104 TaxID=3423409 RepID=UPI003F1B057F
MTHTVVELRQYTLRPGRRDELIELFDREFVETQEATGMTVVGQFRDLDDPDRFVWLRSFPDMRARKASLEAFYGGPVWKRHSAAANATMLDSDDVLLLRPVPGRPGFPSGGPGGGPITATVLLGENTSFPPTGPDAFGFLRTEHAENTFPALPVRTGENALVWFTRGPAPLTPAAGVRGQQLRLSPTARSRLR